MLFWLWSGAAHGQLTSRAAGGFGLRFPIGMSLASVWGGEFASGELDAKHLAEVQ